VKAEICPTCGAKTVEYPHGLSRGLARVIFRICQGLGPDRRFYIGDLDLTYSQRCNAQKLGYWGIIERAQDDTGKGGEWILTELGLAFAQGRIQLRRKVWTYRGDFVRFDGDQILITDVSDGWKYRPDYARERRPHGQAELPL